MYQKINKLSESFGLEVIGISLTPDMPKSQINELEQLILEYKVVVFKNQDLTPEQQIKFCNQFGEIEPHPLKTNTCPYKEMTYVSNVSENGVTVGYPGPSFEIWHSDMCYEPQLPKFSFLYAEQVPDEGGNTLFTNSTLAYEDLEDEVKQKLYNKYAIFGFSKKLMERCKKRGYLLVIDKEDQRVDCVHPVFRTHPLTKKKSIFVNWTHTDYIQGMSEEESDAILEQLYNHSTQQKYVYTHKYDINDLIVWDNSATLHTGDGTIEITKPRIMRRVIVRY